MSILHVCSQYMCACSFESSRLDFYRSVRIRINHHCQYDKSKQIQSFVLGIYHHVIKFHDEHGVQRKSCTYPVYWSWLAHHWSIVLISAIQKILSSIRKQNKHYVQLVIQLYVNSMYHDLCSSSTNFSCLFRYTFKFLCFLHSYLWSSW